MTRLSTRTLGPRPRLRLLKIVSATFCGLALATCVTQAVPPRGTVEGTPSGLAVHVTSSSYGTVTVTTRLGATCALEVSVERGTFGDGPPSSLGGTADGSGVLALTYPAPQVPAGRGRHLITCDDGTRAASASAEFDIASGLLDPRRLHVRVESVAPTTVLAGVTTGLDPSLVPARDEIAAYLAAVLEDEWRIATRGLGALTLVTSSADVVVYLLPGRGTSLNQRSSDGTERVLLYVADGPSVISTGKSLSIALHEIGHSWCCFGPEAGPDEHWLEQTVDPRLAGVNRFGLMVHPVPCRSAAGREVCATRFSDRELAAMGFTGVPAPLADDCSTKVAALDAEIGSLDGALAESGRAIDAANGTLAGLVDQLKAMESRYPAGAMPPDIRAAYVRVAETHDARYRGTNSLIVEYNANVQLRNAAAATRADLPC